MNFWTESKQNVYVAAHRGDSSYYPENTMEAFRAALDEGVDQLETDVRISADGELVIMHDPTVDRTTNGSGKVCELTLAQLKELDAGSHKGAEFAGCKVPTFKEFMDLVQDHPTITLDIELKEYPVEGWEETSFDVCDRVLAMVDEYGFSDRIVINTFSAKLHEYIYKKYGKKYRQHVYFPVDRFADEPTVDPYSYGFCVCMFNEKGHPVKIADKEYFDEMVAKGVEPWAGAFIKDEETVDMAIERGAYLITCNNPGDILALLRAKGYHK